jgi:Crp-like helix-turn-helix protein
MTACELLRVERKAMMDALHRESTLSDMFVEYLLARNIRYEADLVDQLFNSSEKRLARILLIRAHSGKEGMPETVVPKIIHQVLAEMMGTTRLRVSYFMNRFRKLGFIRYNGRHPGAPLTAERGSSRLGSATSELARRAYLANLAEIYDVDVGAQPGVVGEVEAVVIRIFKDHDPVGIPAPVIAETVVVGGDVEVEVVKPETLPIPSCQPKVMAAAKAAVEAAVFPRALDLIIAVAPAAVMSNPAVVGVHVRSVGVPFPVAIGAIFLGLAGFGATRAGTMFRDVLATVVMTIVIAMVTAFVPFLPKGWKSDEQHHHEKPKDSFHDNLRRHELSVADSLKQ